MGFCLYRFAVFLHVLNCEWRLNLAPIFRVPPSVGLRSAMGRWAAIPLLQVDHKTSMTSPVGELISLTVCMGRTWHQSQSFAASSVCLSRLSTFTRHSPRTQRHTTEMFAHVGVLSAALSLSRWCEAALNLTIDEDSSQTTYTTSANWIRPTTRSTTHHTFTLPAVSTNHHHLYSS